MTEPARLDEFDKEEWRIVARRVWAAYTDEDFEKVWAGFIEFKRRKALQ